MEAKVKLNDNSKLMTPDKHVLLPGELGATIEWVVRDTKTGEIKQHQPPKRSESFTKQFLDLLALMFMGSVDFTVGLPVRDTSNVVRTLGHTYYAFDVGAVITSVLYGIIVGTGSTAPTITDYKIETLIAHGVGAGQMQYSAHTFGAPASDAVASQFTITRNFANGSGGAITVGEVALYTRNTKGDITNPFYFMIIRDVIAGGIAVPNGQTLTVNYRPQALV